MPGYNSVFDFDVPVGVYDMPDPLGDEPALTMDQSGTWNAALQGSTGLMEGGTAAQLHAQLDFAPSQGARSNGECCATCRSTFQTAFALDNHAREAIHQAYKCKCGTTFRKHSALKRHIDTKDAPKTFACTLCADKFTRKDKLKDHCRLYHKVTDEGLLFLFESQGLKPRLSATSRRRRAPVPLAAAVPVSAPAVVTAPPTHASAPAVPSVWSPLAYTGQQYADFSTGPFTLAGPCATASTFTLENPLVPASQHVPAPVPFATAPAPGEDITGTVDELFWDETWTTGFGGFNF